MKQFFKRFRDAQRPYCSAIIAAAGSSARMEGENKLFSLLGGMPVLARTLLAVDASGRIDEILIASREEDMLPISALCHSFAIKKPVKVVRGGETRVHSVLLAALEANPEATLLAVQDGARPLVTAALIDEVVAKATLCAAAAPAIPVVDTIKIADGGIITGTPERSSLFAVQTPQVFDAELLKAALKSALDAGVPVTDDCSAVERLGKEVYLTEGSRENLKITTPLDLVIAEAILSERS